MSVRGVERDHALSLSRDAVGARRDMGVSAPALCPCGSAAPYAQCCGALHAGATAASAEALMRARYSAYVQRRVGRSWASCPRGTCTSMCVDYLLDSWHPSTRPSALDLDDPQSLATRWLGLQVRAHTIDDADHARVEFVARFRIGGGSAQRLHEVSRFVREQGRWYYLDGEYPGAAA